jgi:hypothetical protein
MTAHQKVNLAQKLASFDELFSPKIVGYFDDYKVQVGKLQGTSSGTRTRTRTTSSSSSKAR